MIEKIKRLLLNSVFFLSFINLCKRIKINKKEGLSLYLAGFYINKELKQNNISAESKSVAYNFTLAVFPAIIFLFTLIPYLEVLGIGSKDIIEFLRHYMPHDLYSGLQSTIEDLVENKNTGLLSFGFLLALFMSTNGMMSLMGAFNRCYKTVEKRNFMMTRVIAIVLTLVMVVVLIVSMIFVVFGGLLVEALGEYLTFLGWFEWQAIFRYSAYFLTYFLGISVIYYLAPAVTKRWRFFSWGSIIASVMSTLVSLGFSYYVNNFGDYNKVYGSIGALIAFMIWVQWMSIILLLGFEINAGIDRAKNSLIKT